MADFYSSVQNASTDASQFQEGFLEEAIEAEGHDGDEIASSLVSVKNVLSSSVPGIGNETDIYSKNPRVCLLSFCLRIIRSI